MRLKTTRPVSVAIVAFASVAAATAAHATNLGGVLSKHVYSSDFAASNIAPVVFTCDDFALAAATGSALANRPVQRPATCGAFTWASNLGTWTITSGQLGATTANATATISAGQTNVSAEATVLNANGTSRIAGVAINHTGATRIYLAAALSGPSTAQLRLVNGNTITTLASATATISASTDIRITRSGSAVTVSVNGTIRISYTLSGAQVTTLSGGTKVGLYWNSGSTIRFADIFATGPTAP